MSLSNPRKESPVKLYIEYSGATGMFSYYDKENKEKIEIPSKAIRFIVLEEANSITGYSEKLQCGLYSNEVMDLRKEKLTVKSFKGGLQIVGLYQDIKDECIAHGGKFTKSVYGAMIGKDGLGCVNFKFKGSSVDGWFDKKVNVGKQGVIITGFIDKKKGSTAYKVPVFGAFEWTEEQYKKALEMESELQEYFEQSRKHKAEEEHIETTHDEAAEVVNAIANKESVNTENVSVNGNSPAFTDAFGSDLPF